MTRLYGPGATCSLCNRPGALGWVYCCTQDYVDAAENGLSDPYPVNTWQELVRGRITLLMQLKQRMFDKLGHILASKVGRRRAGPASRADHLSFFNEITSEQLSSYCPEQIVAILRQREEVCAGRIEPRVLC